MIITNVILNAGNFPIMVDKYMQRVDCYWDYLSFIFAMPDEVISIYAKHWNGEGGGQGFM